MKVCSNCGTQNPDENQVCCNCQNPLDISCLQPISPFNKSPKYSIFQNKIIICTFIVAILIIIFSILVSTHVICINHEWSAPTCTEPAQCYYCNKYKDNILAEHEWTEATCTSAKICLECRKISGEPLKHIEGNWVVTQEATLTNKGTKKNYCSLCGELLNSSSISKKTPKVNGMSFNFTDKEFIDWVNEISTAYVSDKELDVFDSDSINTSYIIILSDGEKGALLINHDKNKNICAIMVYFDDYTTAVALASFIGEEINNSFSAYTAVEKLLYGKSYTKAEMSIAGFDLSDGFKVALLAPTDYFLDALY